MEKKDLTHRHIARYGRLDRMNLVKEIMSTFGSYDGLMCYYRYRIREEYANMFGCPIIYVKGRDLIEVEANISKLLRDIKLF
jgi:hypothetical protein